MSRLLRFGLVGAAAAAVHLAMVSLLVALGGWHPLVANVVAFLVAFCVSYAGHAGWTFGDSTASARHSLPRFFAVAVSSFVVNEALYALLLAWTPLQYQVALFITLVAVAVLTFVASRYWAFRAPA